ncbi:unnamed protein product [Sphagnum troendelagicum]|uniref:Senescence regulator n=1 Tax=Sphagnum jensenii TaxID=128206 RepID=A0ABP1BVC8_9BRYO
MARLTRAEKLLGISSSPVHSTVLNSGDENELKEEDVWDAQEWPEENTPESHTSYGGSGGSYRTDSSESFRFFNNGKRWLGLEKDPGLSVAFADGGGPSRMIPPTGCAHRETTSRQMMHQSAPVNVPDWSKILGAHKKSVAWVDDTVEEGKDDAQEKMLPPHELLAREYAKSQATTFSVFEGAGRTLKGRDLSRVRTAVLRQTGFLDY